MWLVGHKKWLRWFQETNVWKTFVKSDGHYSSSFYNLVKDDLFMMQNNLKNDVLSPDIADYGGIVLYNRNDFSKPLALAEIEKFKKKFPNFLVVDKISRPYGANKYLMNFLFQDPELRKYRPRCNVYPKKYSSNLAKKIMQDLNSQYYVIKPLNSGRGNGVLLVHANKLDYVLKKILIDVSQSNPAYSRSKEKSDKLIYVSYNPKYYDYWVSDKNYYFLVEEFVPSKAVLVNGKRYDPILRPFFVLAKNKGRIFYKLLALYWYFPKKDLDSNGSFVEKHKADVMPDVNVLVQLEGADKEKVEKILSMVLPKVYKKMISVYYKTQKVKG